MEVTRLKDVRKEESPIHYRRNYTAVAELVLTGGRAADARLAFTIEHSPLGTVAVSVVLVEKLDYPSLPVIKALRSLIESMESKGEIA
jgi:hypothetical protein